MITNIKLYGKIKHVCNFKTLFKISEKIDNITHNVCSKNSKV